MRKLLTHHVAVCLLVVLSISACDATASLAENRVFGLIADSRITHITCSLARAFNEGRLHADQYAKLFALRTEAAELATRAEHFASIGDPRAAQAEWEAAGAMAVLEMACEGVVP